MKLHERMPPISVNEAIQFSWKLYWLPFPIVKIPFANIPSPKIQRGFLLCSQVAEFKFKPKFEPLQVVWQ